MATLSPEQERIVLQLARQLPRNSIAISAMLSRAEVLVRIAQAIDPRVRRCAYCGGVPLFPAACSGNAVFLCALCGLEVAVSASGSGCPCSPPCSPNAVPPCSFAANMRAFLRIDPATIGGRPTPPSGAVGRAGPADGQERASADTREVVRCRRCLKAEVTFFEEQQLCANCFSAHQRDVRAAERRERRPTASTASAPTRGGPEKRPRLAGSDGSGAHGTSARPAPELESLSPRRLGHEPALNTRTAAGPGQSASTARLQAVSQSPSADATCEPRGRADDRDSTPPPHAIRAAVGPRATGLMNVTIQEVVVPPGPFVPHVVAQLIASNPLTVAERNRLAGVSGVGLLGLRRTNAPPPTAEDVHKQLERLRESAACGTVTQYLRNVATAVWLHHHHALYHAKTAASEASSQEHACPRIPWKEEVRRRRWTNEPFRLLALYGLLVAHPAVELIDVRPGRFPWRSWRTHIPALHRELDRLQLDAAAYRRWVVAAPEPAQSTSCVETAAA